MIPYSPLASGRLTRDWSSESTLRSETDQIAKSKCDATAETDRQVVERVAELAESTEFRAFISRLPGYYRRSRLRRRSSGQRRSRIWKMPSALCPLNWSRKRSRTGRAVCAASDSRSSVNKRMRYA